MRVDSLSFVSCWILRSFEFSADTRKPPFFLMGENFAEVWHGDGCLPTLKKMILRTVIENIGPHGNRCKIGNSQFISQIGICENYN